MILLSLLFGIFIGFGIICILFFLLIALAYIVNHFLDKEYARAIALSKLNNKRLK